MKYKIIKINNISGKEASVYSIILNNEEETLLNKFVKENEISFKSETKDILKRLYSIGLTTGARIQFFKEGKENQVMVFVHYLIFQPAIYDYIAFISAHNLL